MRDLMADVRSRHQLQCALVCGKYHADSDIAIRVAVGLNPRAVYPFHPGIKITLRRRDIAVVGRIGALKRSAARHRSFFERAVARVLRRSSDPDPLVAEAGFDAGGDE